MALFTDGFVADVQDLIAYESNLTEVADAEGIDLEGKLRLAQNEVGVDLGAAALGPGNIYWTGTAQAGSFGRFGLDQVVVTSPLKLWHTFQTLATVYRDAYNRKLNDKYLPKWTEYRELSRWASGLLYQTGIGLVTKPVPRPEPPVLDAVAGSLAAQTVYVRMTWLGAGGESAPSAEAALEVGASSNPRVTPLPPPPGITGWNVYVGAASGAETRQNSGPLAAGAPWVMPDTGLALGPAVGEGQEPEFFKATPRFIQRG